MIASSPSAAASGALSVVAREFARHRLRRLPFVGATHAQVRARGRRGDAQLGAGAEGGGVRPEDYYAYSAHVAP